MLTSTTVPAPRSDEDQGLPPVSAPGEVTRYLDALAAGATGAGDALLELLYGELHRVAAACMRRERADHTLQPTALVHELWMRILADGARDYASRAHFLRTAARARCTAP
jgi:RNA polymerase sigma-70 factor (ECF subfamily)